MGRYIKKNEKAFYILAPRIVRKEQEEENQENPETRCEKHICVGFFPIPVFAVEQTQGAKLEYKKIELPDFPLIENAKAWGIDVKGIAFQGKFFGYYQSGEKEKIRLDSPSEKVFFHELSHSVHAKIIGKLDPGQNPKQEIVAELAAQVLAQLVGTEMESSIGNSYEYIQKYATLAKKDVGVACLSVVADVEKILKLILDQRS
ncbi:MAG: antirestriction protein [Candidatus Brocadiae bacterium]|nr:antirestriction protein [Candidatus Brocadiia bacterium]